MFSQISLTPDLFQKFWEKGAAYVLLFTVYINRTAEKNPNSRDLALLNFFSNHDRISPNTTNTISNREVMIMKRNVNKKFSELTLWKLYCKQ